MKHVFIIEAVDVEAGGRELSPDQALYLEACLERDFMGMRFNECVVLSRVNVKSAIAATHEIFGAPEWKP